jgi:hypothetical protein
MISNGNRIVVRQITPSKINLKEKSRPGEKKVLTFSRNKRIYKGIIRG